jgi:hypothetical protein
MRVIICVAWAVVDRGLLTVSYLLWAGEPEEKSRSCGQVATSLSLSVPPSVQEENRATEGHVRILQGSSCELRSTWAGFSPPHL